MSNILSWIIWLPVIGMLVISLIPRDNSKIIKQIAAITSGIQLLLATYLWQVFDSSIGEMQFMERVEWIPSFNITYILGVDGLSCLLYTSPSPRDLSTSRMPSSA